MKGNRYEDKDFGTVVDAEGNELPEIGLAPKSWEGTDLLPEGAKVKGVRKPAAPKTDSEDGAGSDIPVATATREELEAYAVGHGFTEAEAKAYANKDDLRTALVERAAAGSTPA